MLRPLRFQFTHEPDAKRWGPPQGDWWVYDEQALTALPNKRLIALERELDLSLLDVMQGVRDESTLGYHAASWLAIHLAEPEIAGPFEAYEPRTMLIMWQRVPDEDAAVATDPLGSASSESSPLTG